MTHNEGNFDRVLVHIQGESSVAFVPEPVVPTGVTIVAAENKQRILAQTEFLNQIDKPTDV